MVVLLLLQLMLGRADDPISGEATNRQSPTLKKAGLTQNLGKTIDLNLEFTNETGKKVKLAEYFGTTPVVLGLVYYKCPGLCNMVMNGIFRSLQKVKLEGGKEFQTVFVSINPTETSELALEKKKKYLTTYLHSESEKGIHFLVGKEPAIKALSDQVGFKYEYDKESKQYAHPGVIQLLTPEGQISHYFFGIDFPSKDIQLGLVEASHNKIGSPVDHFLLYCFRYDPLLGKYGLVIMNVLKLLGALTIVGIVGFMIVLSKKNRKGLVT